MQSQLIQEIVERVIARLACPDGFATHHSYDPRVVVLGVSARHCHLTAHHVETLFGPGAALNMLRPLRQPGEYASDRQITLVAAGGKCLGPVRVLGPARPASQVEISATDAYRLGIPPPPIRASGDHRGTGGVTLVGPAGAVTLASGLIRPNRHIHMNPAEAAALGLAEGALVDVEMSGERPALFRGCQIRVHPNFVAEMHIDTDDANAVGVKTGDFVRIMLKIP